MCQQCVTILPSLSYDDQYPQHHPNDPTEPPESPLPDQEVSQLGKLAVVGIFHCNTKTRIKDLLRWKRRGGGWAPTFHHSPRRLPPQDTLGVDLILLVAAHHGERHRLLRTQACHMVASHGSARPLTPPRSPRAPYSYLIVVALVLHVLVELFLRVKLDPPHFQLLPHLQRKKQPHEKFRHHRRKEY